MARLVKQFVVRKYVMAFSAFEAIKKEKTYAVSDVFVDEEWLKNNQEYKPANIGFNGKKKN